MKIGCCGILVEDIFCGPMRELPKEGHLLVLDDMPVKAGGCAANIAIDLAKQGWAVEVSGCVGQDVSADMIVACLQKFKIGCTGIVRLEGFQTSKTVILLIEGHDRRYLHIFGANQAFAVKHIDRDWLKSLDVFYLGGLGILPALEMGELEELLKFCRREKITTVVDVVVPQVWAEAEKLPRLLPYIDFFLPNCDEAEQITGHTVPLEQVRAFLAAGAQTVVVTQGKNGAIAARGDSYWQCGAYPAADIDSSGAGDAFSAGIITGIARGWEMPETLRYASALGASATRAIGTTDGVFTSSETGDFIAAHALPMSSGHF